MLKPTGEYTRKTVIFTGTNGTWRLTGTETGNTYLATDAIDEFINDATGERKTVRRGMIYQLWIQGHIK